MIEEIQRIIEQGEIDEEVEIFPEGTMDVTMNILQKIYTAGYKEGSS